MFCANWLISSRVMVTVSVEFGMVPNRFEDASRWLTKWSRGSVLVGDSTSDPAKLDWSEVDWNDEIEELVSSKIKGLALWLLVPFPDPSAEVDPEMAEETIVADADVAVLLLSTPWMFFKCLVLSPLYLNALPQMWQMKGLAPVCFR